MVKTTDIRVSELMKPAKIVAKETEINKALHIIRTEHVDFLSVVDENHNLIGALSEGNFLRLVKQESPSPIGDPVWYDSIDREVTGKPIESIMTTGITTISPNDTCATALKVMNASGYKLLHVVDESGKLLGTVRMKDIIHKLIGD